MAQVIINYCTVDAPKSQESGAPFNFALSDSSLFGILFDIEKNERILFFKWFLYNIYITVFSLLYY